MWAKIKDFLSTGNLEIIDPIMNKIGITSITTTFSVQAVKAQEIITPEINTIWVLADYALALSIVGSVLFIIEKLVVIYIRLKNKNKKID